MSFGVIFVLLMVVSGGWLYSRWAEMRDAEARRREAEMMVIFEARSDKSSATPAVPIAGSVGRFQPTLPGES